MTFPTLLCVSYTRVQTCVIKLSCSDVLLLKGATIPEKRVGTRSKFSPPPTFNVDNQVIFALFCWNKCAIFQHWLGGKGVTRYGLSVPTTFGWDCRKGSNVFTIKKLFLHMYMTIHFQSFFQLPYTVVLPNKIIIIKLVGELPMESTC